MADKDVFGLGDDEDRTLIRPNPGGRLTAQSIPKSAASGDEEDRTRIMGGGPAAAPAAPPMPATPPAVTGSSPLIAAAARSLMLAGKLAGTAQMANISALRTAVAEELSAYDAACRAAGVEQRTERMGHYVLCALIDDIVLSRPWGANSGWSERSLVASHHNEVVSGDRMFQLAEQLEAAPNRAPDVLELVYLAFSLGFEGKLRIDPRGPALLAQYRDRLFRAWRQNNGSPERALSRHWRGVDSGHRPLRRILPLWVIWAGFGLLALALFAGLLYSLNIKSDEAVEHLYAATQAPAPQLRRAAPPAIMADDPFPKMAAILKPDIDAQKVELFDNGASVTIRLLNNGLFASGKAEIDAGYGDTLKRAALALGLTKGAAAIDGHTDNLAIRTLQFPSNFQLSLARANAVAALLAADGVDKARLTAQGRADSMPVAPNATEQGREKNRRVDITVQKAAGW